MKEEIRRQKDALKEFIEWWRQDIKTGEILTDRRREVCEWLLRPTEANPPD